MLLRALIQTRGSLAVAEFNADVVEPGKTMLDHVKCDRGHHSIVEEMWEDHGWLWCTHENCDFAILKGDLEFIVRVCQAKSREGIGLQKE